MSLVLRRSGPVVRVRACQTGIIATEDSVSGGVEVVGGAGSALQFAALFVHQQLALGALEALATQAPDAVLAECAGRPLVENTGEL